MALGLIYYVPLAVAILVVLQRYFAKERDARSFPPGPKGHFILGNLLDRPLDNAENVHTFLKWRQDYGCIMHAQFFGYHLIALNTAQAVTDLMDKRAYMYSNRPRMVMLDELVGNDWLMATISGEPHRERRAVAQRYFLGQIKDWQPVQLESARTLLQNIFTNPSDWAPLVRMSIASTVLGICYGQEITQPSDPLLKIALDALDSPRNGPYLVDLFPLLKYYPSWLPGGGFQNDAAEARMISQRLRNIPFDMVRDQMAAGTAIPSFISTLLSQLPPDEDQEYAYEAGLIRDAAAGMYIAAMDSTVSSMFTFFGAMVMYPDIQRRAQRDLDEVVGHDRLPTFEDRFSLPFIECIVLEVLRLNVVTPLGIPHLVTEEDEYLGYRIPKNALVLGNTWAILRDPEVFPNPDQFDPSRFLAATPGSTVAREVLDGSVFGWGKRACPGRHVGQSTLFIMCAHLLACFDIAAPVDAAAGNTCEPVLQYYSKMFIRRAMPIPCTIRLRSNKTADLFARPE